MALVFLASFYSLCLILLVRYIRILHWLFLCVAIRVSLWAKKLVSNSGLSLQFLDEEQAHTRGKKKSNFFLIRVSNIILSSPWSLFSLLSTEQSINIV